MVFVRALFALLKQACGHVVILCRLTSKAGSCVAHNIEGFELRYSTRLVLIDYVLICPEREGDNWNAWLGRPAQLILCSTGDWLRQIR